MGMFVIAGGNGGIGLQVGRDLLARGHNVLLLGRNRKKGAEALASLGDAHDRAEFLSVDLSTHAGVRTAAELISSRLDQIDGLLHSAAVFETGNVRTEDDIPLFAALSFYSRYHLTQLLMPKLLKAPHPRVMMFIAGLPSTPTIDPAPFPYFRDFSFFKHVIPLNGACLYLADHLMKQHPQLFAGCATPGFVRTGIFDTAPWYLRAYVALTAPFRAIKVETAASNVVQALLGAEGKSARMWTKPGDYKAGYDVVADPVVEQRIMQAARTITGA
ncbi:MAG: SDR family NAD(P)-dependent oxidoreductase [Alphaproteobacteria bacterium]|nr:SDR family NAD(P)-dependent oxidoreductase [Alphaproteobacteria bacterium]